MVHLPFTPNHILLVDACYPPTASLLTSGPDYRPNSQELSRLTYYASNRPGKLTKLGNELEKRVKVESRKAQGRNLRARASLLITLAIFKALATECRRDISLLSPSLIASVNVTLSVLPSDLQVTARVASVFTAWSTYTDGQLLGVDADVTRDYMAALTRFAHLSIIQSKSDDLEDRNRTRLVGLAALSGVVTSETLYHSISQFKSQVSIVVPALVTLAHQAELSMLEDEAAVIKSKPSPSSPYLSEFRPRPVAERRAASIHVHVDGDRGPSSADVTNACLRAFLSLFSQANGGQVGQVLQAIFDSFDDLKAWDSLAHCCWFAQKAAEWTQYQYRYAVPTRLVERLVASQDAPTPSAVHFALAAMVTTVFTAPTPLVNLSTSDIISNLITLIVHRAAINPEDALLSELVKCIAALGTHVYYADQIHDLAGELISRLIGIEGNGVQGRGRAGIEHGRVQAIRCLLAGLIGLMQAADHHEVPSDNNNGQNGSNGSTVTPQESPNHGSRSSRRTRISPETWQDTLTLLCDADYAVRADYSRALVFFLRNEIPGDGEYFDDDGVRHVRPLSEGPIIRPESLASDSVARFLNAVHASVYVLATSRSLGTGSSSLMPSLAPSLTENGHVSVNVVPSSPVADAPPSSLLEEDRSQDSPNHSQSNRRQSVNATQSRKSSVAQRLLDQAPPHNSVSEGAAACASDYAHIAEILAAIHERLPCHGLFVGIPMSFALEKNAHLDQIESFDSKILARKEVVARVWSVVGKVWGCSEIMELAEKTLSATSCLPLIDYTQDGLIHPSDTGVPFPTEKLNVNVDVPTAVDLEAVIVALVSNATVQSATGMDRQAVLRRLTVEWTVESALRDSVERFSMHDVNRADGISPLLKISPALMHIDNVSLQSLARSTRGLGVSDLREALEGRSSMSNPALVTKAASFSTVDHSSLAGDAVFNNTSRPRPKRPLNRGSGEVRDVLNRLGIGKQNGENLLKASFPALKKRETRSSALLPPYKT